MKEVKSKNNLEREESNYKRCLGKEVKL